jgi:hypothetical protein
VQVSINRRCHFCFGSADARIASAVAFGWRCAGYAVALGLTATGLLLAFYGYSFMISAKPSADAMAKAIADSFQKAEIRTSVSGLLELKDNSEVTLAPGQFIQLSSSDTLKLDPASTVKVTGDLKVDIPQPSHRRSLTDCLRTVHDRDDTNHLLPSNLQNRFRD